MISRKKYSIIDVLVGPEIVLTLLFNLCPNLSSDASLTILRQTQRELAQYQFTDNSQLFAR